MYYLQDIHGYCKQNNIATMHLMGHSAGGHLAYCALLEATVRMVRLLSFFLFSCVYDLVPLVYTDVNDPIV